jgi:hypothetical protein
VRASAARYSALSVIGYHCHGLAVVLLKSGDAMGLVLMSLIRADDVVVRAVNGLTEGDLLDAALLSYPRPNEACHLWLERINASESDASVLANCELLIQGCNKCNLEAALLTLNDGARGLENVVQTATDYIERLSRMRECISALMDADSASEAKCAATLLLPLRRFPCLAFASDIDIVLSRK